MTEKTMIQPDEIAAEAQKTVEKMTKNMEGAASFGQQNLDAVVEASRLVAKAAEGMSQELMAFSKKSYEESVAAAKDITQAKSVVELVEKQSAYSKASMDSVMGEMSKLSEMMADAFKDCAAPLTARVTASVDYAKTLSA